MRYYADDSYLHARIYAMRSRLIPSDGYAPLQREYEALYADPHGMIEAKEGTFREQIAPIIHLAEATERYAPLFIAFLRRYEANNVKLLLAKAFGRRSIEQWYDIGPYALLDRDLFDGDPAPDDLQAALAGTYLDGIFEGRATYERIEDRVDILTARHFFDTSDAFPPEGREVFRDFILRRLAVLMVIRQWRLRVTYGWSDERIWAYRDELGALFGETDWPQVRELVGVLVRRLREMGGQTPGPAEVESFLERSYYRWVASMFHRDFHSVYCVMAYLWLLDYQIRNLLCIIEGIRFGLSPEAILETIISN